MIYVCVWRKGIPRSVDSKGKSPEIEVSLMCLRNIKKSSPMTTVQGVREVVNKPYIQVFILIIYAQDFHGTKK